MKGAKKMQNLSQMELNSIREVATAHKVVACKLEDYSNKCQDKDFKQMFSQASQKCNSSIQNLISMMN